MREKRRDLSFDRKQSARRLLLFVDRKSYTLHAPNKYGCASHLTDASTLMQFRVSLSKMRLRFVIVLL